MDMNFWDTLIASATLDDLAHTIVVAFLSFCLIKIFVDIICKIIEIGIKFIVRKIKLKIGK